MKKSKHFNLNENSMLTSVQQNQSLHVQSGGKKSEAGVEGAPAGKSPEEKSETIYSTLLAHESDISDRIQNILPSFLPQINHTRELQEETSQTPTVLNDKKTEPFDFHEDKSQIFDQVNSAQLSKDSRMHSITTTRPINSRETYPLPDNPSRIEMRSESPFVKIPKERSVPFNQPVSTPKDPIEDLPVKIDRRKLVLNSPLTLKTSQLNSGKVLPTRGGGGAMPYGPRIAGTFGFGNGFTSPKSIHQKIQLDNGVPKYFRNKRFSHNVDTVTSKGAPYLQGSGSNFSELHFKKLYSPRVSPLNREMELFEEKTKKRMGIEGKRQNYIFDKLKVRKTQLQKQQDELHEEFKRQQHEEEMREKSILAKQNREAYEAYQKSLDLTNGSFDESWANKTMDKLPNPKDFKIPGDYEKEVIFRMDEEDVMQERFDDSLGKLSWKQNPQNSIDLYKKYLKDMQLFQLLQCGLTFEDKVARLEDNNIPPNRKNSSSQHGETTS